MKYKLVYLPLFVEDLDEAWFYITFKLKNPAATNKLMQDTESAILARAKAPKGFEPYKSKREREHLYYRIHVRNYTIWYVLIDDVMEVRRFLYKRRNIADNL